MGGASQEEAIQEESLFGRRAIQDGRPFRDGAFRAGWQSGEEAIQEGVPLRRAGHSAGGFIQERGSFRKGWPFRRGREFSKGGHSPKICNGPSQDLRKDTADICMHGPLVDYRPVRSLPQGCWAPLLLSSGR